MSFGDLFPVDPPEPEPEPAIQHEQPEWFGPPSGELPVAVPLGVVLGRSPRGVVALSHALVHSTGVQFQVVAHVDGLRAGESNMIFHEQHAGRMGLPEPPRGFLRFGIELPDGARVSNLSEGGRRRSPAEEATGPVLSAVRRLGRRQFDPYERRLERRLLALAAPRRRRPAPLLRVAGRRARARERGDRRRPDPRGRRSRDPALADGRPGSVDAWRRQPAERLDRCRLPGPGWSRTARPRSRSGTVSPAQLAALRRALEHTLALLDGLRKPD